jgi:ubiquinone/menaquinone biosynthesis C-methylase UbiE
MWSDDGPYDARVERYVIRGGREGYDRLKVLAQARWPDTAALLKRAGVRRGMRCVDLGTGGGAVAFELARLVGPNGSVVGIDMDDVKLDLARAEADRMKLTNIEFRMANVNDWNEAASYDLVYSRFLLEHLPRPLDVLRRMWEAVKPSGALIVEVTDFDGLFCEPANEGFAFYARMFPRVVASYGGDSRLGRRLYRLFLEVGTSEPHVKLVQRADATGAEKTLALLTLEATAQAVVEAGLATLDEVRSASSSLEEFIADRTTIVSGPRIFQVWSRRTEVARVQRR